MDGLKEEGGETHRVGAKLRVRRKETLPSRCPEDSTVILLTFHWPERRYISYPGSEGSREIETLF
jgi:hypothetical protein